MKYIPLSDGSGMLFIQAICLRKHLPHSCSRST